MAASPAQSAIVVGAGIVGLLSARALARRGWRVSVIERGEPMREASWAGGGILCPLYPWREPAAVWELAQRSLVLYPQLIAEVEKRTGVTAGYLPSGLVYVDAAESAQAAAWALSARLPVRAQRSAEGERTCLAWVHQVRNPRLGRALLAELPQLGVELVRGEAVQSLWIEAGRARGVRTAARTLAAEQVCICAGAWSAELIEPTGWDLRIEPVRGQMLLLRTAEPAPQQILLSRGVYLIPRDPDLLLVGSTVEHAGFDKTTTAQAREALLQAAGEIWPSLRKAKLEAHWAGLRPGSPDGVPFIGAHPRIPNLWVNAGHYRNGLTLAPASAEKLAELIEACSSPPTVLSSEPRCACAGRPRPADPPNPDMEP